MATKKTTQAQATQEVSVEALRVQIAKLRSELRVGKVKDVRSVSKLRDQLARQLTAQRIKELGAV